MEGLGGFVFLVVIAAAVVVLRERSEGGLARDGAVRRLGSLCGTDVDFPLLQGSVRPIYAARFVRVRGFESLQPGLRPSTLLMHKPEGLRLHTLASCSELSAQKSFQSAFASLRVLHDAVGLLPT